MRCVNLLETIDDGTIHLDGRDITDPRVNADRVRRQIGIVFQSFNLFPHMTVLDNITLAPRRVHGITDAEAAEDARWPCSNASAWRHARRNTPTGSPAASSSGSRSSGRWSTSPRLLLLDEVTSALDPELVGEVLTMIRDLKAEGMTMVLATHEMGFARQVADRVCFLERGRILEQGPPEQVFGNPTQARTQQFLQRIIEAGRL